MFPVRKVNCFILAVLLTAATAAPSRKGVLSKRVASVSLRDVVAQSTSSGNAATSGNASAAGAGNNAASQTGGGSSIGSSSQSVTQAQGSPDSVSGYAAGGSTAYGESTAEGSSDASGSNGQASSDSNTQGTSDTETDSSVTITNGSRLENGLPPLATKNPMPVKFQQTGMGRSNPTICGLPAAENNGSNPSSVGASTGSSTADASASQGGVGEADVETITGSLSTPNYSVACGDALAHATGTDGSTVHSTSSSGTTSAGPEWI